MFALSVFVLTVEFLLLVLVSPITNSIFIPLRFNSSANCSIFLRKRSFTHCITKRLGALIRTVSPSIPACNGLIQVLNCCAESSFSNRLRQAGQKFSISYQLP